MWGILGGGTRFLQRRKFKCKRELLYIHGDEVTFLVYNPFVKVFGGVGPFLQKGSDTPKNFNKRVINKKCDFIAMDVQ